MYLKLKNLFLFLFTAFFLLLFSQGCDKGVVYESNIEVSVDSWNKDDFCRFGFTIHDTTIPYNLYINIRNSVEYPYSNLFLFIRTELPDGQLARDTLDISLANAEGKWRGRGIGKFRDSEILIMHDFLFPQRGDYIFEIEHAMRDIDIDGISSVGLKVEKSRMN